VEKAKHIPTARELERVFRKREAYFDCCTAFRLLHHETHRGLTLDYYGGYLLLTNYEDLRLPMEAVEAIAKEAQRAMQGIGLPVRGAVTKGRPKDLPGRAQEKDSAAYRPVLLFGETPPARFVIHEYDLKFLVSLDEGHSTGVFLDMKNGRRLIAELAQSGRHVLNLFSYTGGFSLAAARGGAERVIEVDIGAKWLRWAQENQRLNGVTVVRQRREDARKFLRKQKDEAFDIVICDPPAYSTQTRGPRFHVADGLREMAPHLARVLRPGGHLLACANYRGLDRKAFLGMFTPFLRSARTVPVSEDFARDRHLKAALFCRGS